jgi:hypothetical protein
MEIASPVIGDFTHSRILRQKKRKNGGVRKNLLHCLFYFSSVLLCFVFQLTGAKVVLWIPKHQKNLCFLSFFIVLSIKPVQFRIEKNFFEQSCASF